MSDSGFREIQLSGKHVVFLFMAGVVVAVAIFLLGVSVGRGVAKPDAAAQAASAPVEPMAAGTLPAEPPARTTPEQGELKYQDTLKGDAKAAAAPAAPPKAPEKPAATATPSPKPAAKPNAAAPAAPAAGAVWFVPVASFTSSSNAEKQVAQLKAKGITAMVYDAGQAARLRYRVRVGPLEKAAADAMVVRLRKEGLKPSAPIR